MTAADDYGPFYGPDNAKPYPPGFVEEREAWVEIWNEGWTQRGFVFENQKKDKSWEYCFDPQYSIWGQSRGKSWRDLLAKLRAQAEARGGLD